MQGETRWGGEEMEEKSESDGKGNEREIGGREHKRKG